VARLDAAQRQGDTSGAQEGLQQARTAFQRALAFAALPGAATNYPEWDPAKTHALLGQVFLFLGESAAARAQFEASLRLMPSGQIADTNRQFLSRIESGAR